MTTTHILKTWPALFNAVATGAKTFDVRKDDRAFQAGDVVHLVYHDPNEPEVTPRTLDQRLENAQRFRIGFVLRGGQFGLEPGYVAFSLLPMPQQTGPKLASEAADLSEHLDRLNAASAPRYQKHDGSPTVPPGARGVSSVFFHRIGDEPFEAHVPLLTDDPDRLDWSKVAMWRKASVEEREQWLRENASKPAPGWQLHDGIGSARPPHCDPKRSVFYVRAGSLGKQGPRMPDEINWGGVMEWRYATEPTAN